MGIPDLEKRLKARELPRENPFVLQDWNDLFFFHWKYSPEEIQKHLPKGLFVDTYKDEAFVGIVPFHISNFKPYIFPSIFPGLCLNELNVRTYVYDKLGIPGVWFFSLDANSLFMVEASKLIFGLPYIYSTLHFYKHDQHPKFSLERDKTELIYSGDLDVDKFEAEPDTLEFFLIERYHLYSLHKGRLKRGKVHHQHYPLQNVRNVKADPKILELDNLPPQIIPPLHSLYAKQVNVKFYHPQLIE